MFVKISLIFFLSFIYLFERGNTSRGSGRGRNRLEQSREPDVGLHPRTLGSCPEQKADA